MRGHSPPPSAWRSARPPPGWPETCWTSLWVGAAGPRRSILGRAGRGRPRRSERAGSLQCSAWHRARLRGCHGAVWRCRSPGTKRKFFSLRASLGEVQHKASCEEADELHPALCSAFHRCERSASKHRGATGRGREPPAHRDTPTAKSEAVQHGSVLTILYDY